MKSPTSNDAIIEINGLWKRYGLPIGPALRRTWRRLRGCPGDIMADGPWALRDVNLEVRRGETVGIIGRNGAGKSTLLKVLAGVTLPTRGQLVVRGQVFPMIELNAGLHMELTGRENVHLLGAVMGMTRAEAAEKMPAIEHFCELGEWFEQPVRKYSSGMLARLGFGVAMHVNTDILLIDEVLSVGDYAFQKKCVMHMERASTQGMTIVIVSHNPYMIERLCDRALLLQAGEALELDKPGDVIPKYFMMGMEQEKALGSSSAALLPDQRPGTGNLRIQKVEILNSDGLLTSEVCTGGPITFRLHFRTKEPILEPTFGIRILDPQNTVLAVLSSVARRKGLEIFGEGHIDCKVRSLPLMPNIYSIQVKATGHVLLDMYDNAVQFTVRPEERVLLDTGYKGLIHVEHDWHYNLEK